MRLRSALVLAAISAVASIPALVRADMEGWDEPVDDPEPAYPRARRSDRVVRGWDEMNQPAAYALRGRRLVRVAAPEPPRPALPPGIEDDGTVDVFRLDGVRDRGRALVATVTDRVDAENGWIDGRQVRIHAGRRLVAIFGDEPRRFGADVRAAGDVDGDGLVDLLVASPSACDCCDCSGFTDQLHLYRQTESRDPRRRFERVATIHGPNGMQNWIRALPVGDVDRDGRGDVVVAHGEELRLHRGRPRGIEVDGERLHRRRAHSNLFSMERLPGGRAGLFWVDWSDGTAGLARRRGRRLRTAPLAMPSSP